MRSGLSSRLRQKPCALLYRAAQFKNFGGADSPAKQQVPIDRLSVVRDVGTEKRNAYPYAAYGAPAQRDWTLNHWLTWAWR